MSLSCPGRRSRVSIPGGRTALGESVVFPGVTCVCTAGTSPCAATACTSAPSSPGIPTIGCPFLQSVHMGTKSGCARGNAWEIWEEEDNGHRWRIDIKDSSPCPASPVPPSFRCIDQCCVVFAQPGTACASEVAPNDFFIHAVASLESDSVSLGNRALQKPTNAREGSLLNTWKRA